MTQKEMAVLIRAIGEEIEEVAQKGKSPSGFTTIEARIERYSRLYDEHQVKKTAKDANSK